MSEGANTKKGSKLSKIVGIVSTVFLALCVCTLLYTTISYSTTGLVNFFGYSFHVIQSPSMEPAIKVGDLVIVKQVPFDQINVGDDILFRCEDSSLPVYGMFVVHRVKETTETEGVYWTYGINNNGRDDAVPSKAKGKVVSVNSSLGGLFTFVTNGRNILFVVAIFGAAIFIVMQVCSVISNSVNLKKEKDKEELEKDSELRDRIKKEVEAELLSGEKANKSGDIDATTTEDTNNQEEHKNETNSRSDKVWSIQ